MFSARVKRLDKFLLTIKNSSRSNCPSWSRSLNSHILIIYFFHKMMNYDYFRCFFTTGILTYLSEHIYRKITVQQELKLKEDKKRIIFW